MKTVQALRSLPIFFKARQAAQSLGRMYVEHATALLVIAFGLFATAVISDIFAGGFDREIKVFLIMNVPLVATAAAFLVSLVRNHD